VVRAGKRGRQRVFSDAAIQFCLSIKCLFNLALRQSLGLVESVLRLAGLDWSVPDFSTVCRRQKALRVQLPYRASTTALDLLVDSTGIKFLGEGEWKRKKHGAEFRQQWHKVHLGIDAHTLEIRAIEVTDNSVEDGADGAPMLPAQIPPDEALASVSADGAYDTKACHAAIVQRGAQAGTPPRKNGQTGKATLMGASVRNEALKAFHQL
jgi:IS5 family transposase